VQLAATVVGVVHAADAGAELEAQGRVVTQQAGHGSEVLAAHEEGDLAAVHDHLFDRTLQPGVAGALGQGVGDVVHPPAVRRLGGTGQLDGAGQAAVAGGVAAAADPEHALPAADLLGAGVG
jgi:hypothetical protein